MTAVQQYWIVENDRYLVSSIYPVLVDDTEARLLGGVLMALDYGVAEGENPAITDAAPMIALDYTIQTFVTSYDNLFDTADRQQDGGPMVPLSYSVASAVIGYDNLFDPADRQQDGGPMTPSSYSVVTIVVTYDNLFDNADRQQDAAPMIPLSYTVT